jgi:hypothetical protein
VQLSCPVSHMWSKLEALCRESNKQQSKIVKLELSLLNNAASLILTDIGVQSTVIGRHVYDTVDPNFIVRFVNKSTNLGHK